MNYYGAKDLANSFRTVRKNTIIIAEEINEKDYGFRAAPDTRTVAHVLVHIGLSPSFQEQIHVVERRTTMEGFDFGFFQRMAAEEQAPRDKAQIVSLLREGGDRFGTWLEGLSEDFLAGQVALPAVANAPPKTRFEMLLGVKEHEMHHRAQLMLIERILGVVPHLTREMQRRIAAMTAANAS